MELIQAPANPVWPPQTADKRPRQVRVIVNPNGTRRAESLSEIADAEKITFDKLIDLNFGVTKGNPSGDRWARIINWYLKTKLNAAPMADGNFKFNGGETIYVPKAAEPAEPVDTILALALADVNDFEARPGVGKFLHYQDRKAFAADLRERIKDPGKINQGNAGLCPSASVLIALARTNVRAYAKLVIDLYERGEARLNGWELKPCQDLLAYQLPADGKIKPVDWVPMASIRDSENWLIDYQSIEDEGGAWGNEVARWLRRAGFKTVVEDWRFDRHVPESNIRNADTFYQNDHQVLLLIKAPLLWGKPASDRITASHWVVLASPVTFGTDAAGDTTVSFTVFSWGKRYSIPNQGTMKLKDFLDYDYGFVACKF
ncbi:MAG: hypothetical protein KIT36_16945 [Alphaproteobacteria bacterium]|nr:hypothetical protein [Alphaproteobacteria bacterium]